MTDRTPSPALEKTYLALAVLGAVLPWFFFAQYLVVEGTWLSFVPDLFVNQATGGLTADLLVSSLVFWVFLFREARHTGVARPWVYVAVNLLIGLSCALPLFLWARQRALAPGHG